MAEKQTDIETIAWVLEKHGEDFQLMDIVLDEVRSDEYLVEMKWAGICHTVSPLEFSSTLPITANQYHPQDLVIQQGALKTCQLPAILGHEGAGYVRAIGSNVAQKDIQVGDFVLLSFNYCRECKQCKGGHPGYCQGGAVLHMKGVRQEDGSDPARLKKDGRAVRSQFYGQSSFAKMSVVKDSSVVKYPYDPEGAAIFAACGCGYQTGAGTVLNVLQPQKDDSVVVFGLGGVGLTALMAAKYLGVRQIVAVDIVDERLAVAKELGATDVLNSKDVTDLVDKIKQLTGGGADFALDCAGTSQLLFGDAPSILMSMSRQHPRHRRYDRMPRP